MDASRFLLKAQTAAFRAFGYLDSIGSLPPPGGHGQAEPAGDQTETADRGDGAEPGDAGEAEQVEGAGEDQVAGEEEPAGGCGPGVEPAGAGPGDGQQGEGVIHLVASGDFEEGILFRGEFRFEHVTAKGTGGYGGETEETAEEEEAAVDHRFLPM